MRLILSRPGHPVNPTGNETELSRHRHRFRLSVAPAGGLGHGCDRE